MTTTYRQTIEITHDGHTVTRTFDAHTEGRLRFRVDSYLSKLDPAFDVDVAPVETIKEEKENHS